MIRERYTLTIESLPQGPPAMQKPKLASKALLRRFGLRIVDIRQEADVATPKPQNARQLPLSIARGGETGHQRHGDARSAPRTCFDTVRGQDAAPSLPDGLASIPATSRDIEDSETSEGSGPL